MVSYGFVWFSGIRTRDVWLPSQNSGPLDQHIHNAITTGFLFISTQLLSALQKDYAGNYVGKPPRGGLDINNPVYIPKIG